MRLSIAIASHNEGDNLWRTVRSCLETTPGMNPEIVVVDDASTDGSIAELTRRHGGDVKVITASQRRGVAAAKDLAIRSTNGDLVVMLDAHCKPEPGAIAGLVRGVESWKGEAIVCPVVSSLSGKTWRNKPDRLGYGCGVDLEWFTFRWLMPDELRRVVGPDGRPYHASPALPGCSHAFSRELYEKIGGFDANMRSWGAEDTDLALKAWFLGYQIVTDFDSVIGHVFRTGEVPYSIPDEHLLFNDLRMARKNFGNRAWDDWFERVRTSSKYDGWEGALALFEADREAIERERDDLLTRRTRDEYWYALMFGMAWPLTLPGSPYPVPFETARKQDQLAASSGDEKEDEKKHRSWKTPIPGKKKKTPIPGKKKKTPIPGKRKTPEPPHRKGKTPHPPVKKTPITPYPKKKTETPAPKHHKKKTPAPKHHKKTPYPPEREKKTPEPPTRPRQAPVKTPEPPAGPRTDPESRPKRPRKPKS